jgi:hypothetical protein
MSKEDKLYKPSMFTHTLEIHVVMVIIVMLAISANVWEYVGRHKI